VVTTSIQTTTFNLLRSNRCRIATSRWLSAFGDTERALVKDTQWIERASPIVPLCTSLKAASLPPDPKRKSSLTLFPHRAYKSSNSIARRMGIACCRQPGGWDGRRNPAA
jgi:hypothetical protein